VVPKPLDTRRLTAEMPCQVTFPPFCIFYIIVNMMQHSPVHFFFFFGFPEAVKIVKVVVKHFFHCSSDISDNYWSFCLTNRFTGPSAACCHTFTELRCIGSANHRVTIQLYERLKHLAVVLLPSRPKHYFPFFYLM
jgi:hypothetical protein